MTPKYLNVFLFSVILISIDYEAFTYFFLTEKNINPKSIIFKQLRGLLAIPMPYVGSMLTVTSETSFRCNSFYHCGTTIEKNLILDSSVRGALHPHVIVTTIKRRSCWGDQTKALISQHSLKKKGIACAYSDLSAVERCRLVNCPAERCIHISVTWYGQNTILLLYWNIYLIVICFAKQHIPLIKVKEWPALFWPKLFTLFESCECYKSYKQPHKHQEFLWFVRKLICISQGNEGCDIRGAKTNISIRIIVLINIGSIFVLTEQKLFLLGRPFCHLSRNTPWAWQTVAALSLLVSISWLILGGYSVFNWWLSWVLSNYDGLLSSQLMDLAWIWSSQILLSYTASLNQIQNGMYLAKQRAWIRPDFPEEDIFI